MKARSTLGLGVSREVFLETESLLLSADCFLNDNDSAVVINCGNGRCWFCSPVLSSKANERRKVFPQLKAEKESG